MNQEIKQVTELYKQSFDWKLTSKHTFFTRNYKCDNFGNFYRNDLIVKNKVDKKGNIFVSLVDDEKNSVRFRVHQIVFQTFNPNVLIDFTSVDHIDKVRVNNNISNLRLGTREIQSKNRDNTSYKYKKVYCVNNKKIYFSCNDAEKDLQLVKNTVSRVARGERKSIHGYKFIFN